MPPDGDRNINAKYYAKEYRLKLFRTNVMDWQAPVNAVNFLQPVIHILVQLTVYSAFVPDTHPSYLHLTSNQQQLENQTAYVVTNSIVVSS